MPSINGEKHKPKLSGSDPKGLEKILFSSKNKYIYI